MATTKTSTVHDLYPEIVEWRRDFHQHAESGWVEFRTASLVASRLEEWGYEVKAGKEVVDEESRMGVPSESFLKEQEERALAQGLILSGFLTYQAVLPEWSDSWTPANPDLPLASVLIWTRSI